MTPTEEQLKEIEQEAKEYTKKNLVWAPDSFTVQYAFEAGATAQLSKSPLSADQAREAVELLKSLSDRMESPSQYFALNNKIESFLTKIKKP